MLISLMIHRGSVETFLRKTLNKWSSRLLSVFGEKRKKISAHDQTLRGSEKDRRTCVILPIKSVHFT